MIAGTILPLRASKSIWRPVKGDEMVQNGGLRPSPYSVFLHESCRYPLFHEIPSHRITRLRRQGERYFADGLRELPDNRRLAILAVCAVEWKMFLADAVVETHDRVVGRTYREAARTCEVQLGDETAAVREALRAFAKWGGR